MRRFRYTEDMELQVTTGAFGALAHLSQRFGFASRPSPSSEVRKAGGPSARSEIDAAPHLPLLIDAIARNSG